MIICHRLLGWQHRHLRHAIHGLLRGHWRLLLRWLVHQPRVCRHGHKLLLLQQQLLGLHWCGHHRRIPIPTAAGAQTVGGGDTGRLHLGWRLRCAQRSHPALNVIEHRLREDTRPCAQQLV